MATTTLLIPRVIARQLTEIAQLGKFSVFPATPKCSHWAVYDSHKTELACPCAPLEPDAKLLIRTMAAILQENFVQRSEPCETPFSRADTTQQIKRYKIPKKPTIILQQKYINVPKIQTLKNSKLHNPSLPRLTPHPSRQGLPSPKHSSGTIQILRGQYRSRPAHRCRSWRKYPRLSRKPLPAPSQAPPL